MYAKCELDIHTVGMFFTLRYERKLVDTTVNRLNIHFGHICTYLCMSGFVSMFNYDCGNMACDWFPTKIILLMKL